MAHKTICIGEMTDFLSLSSEHIQIKYFGESGVSLPFTKKVLLFSFYSGLHFVLHVFFPLCMLLVKWY